MHISKILLCLLFVTSTMRPTDDLLPDVITKEQAAIRYYEMVKSIKAQIAFEREGKGILFIPVYMLINIAEDYAKLAEIPFDKNIFLDDSNLLT